MLCISGNQQNGYVTYREYLITSKHLCFQMHFLLLCGVIFEFECTMMIEHKFNANAKCLIGFLATEMPERILTRMSIQQQKIGFNKLRKQFRTFSFTHYNRMIPFSLALFISPNGVTFLHHLHVPLETDPPVC